MLPQTDARARVLLLAEDPIGAASTDLFVDQASQLGTALRTLCTEARLDEGTVLLRVTPATADAVAEALPGLLEQLPALEVAVLMGPLASETWRRHPAFQLHLTLVDAPAPWRAPAPGTSSSPEHDATAQVRAALTGVAAMVA